MNDIQCWLSQSTFKDIDKKKCTERKKLLFFLKRVFLPLNENELKILEKSETGDFSALKKQRLQANKKT